MIAFGYAASLLYGAICLLISALLFKLGVPKKYTRKVVHILVGFEWAILYHTVGTGIHFVAVCLIFTALLAFTYKKSLMPMISSDSDNAPGTVYYGISMTVLSVISLFAENFVFSFGIAVFCTSIGDGFAGVFGAAAKRMNTKIYGDKTLVGTACAFIFSLISVFVFSAIYSLNITPIAMLLIALFSAGLELIMSKGLDNISIPIGTALFAHFITNSEFAYDYVLPIILTPFIIAVVVQKKALTRGGLLAAIILDVTVSVTMKNFGFVLLLAFLVLSIVIDKIKKHFGKKSDAISNRGDERDEIQVFANGIVPLLCAVLYFITGQFAFVIGYNAALAECFADTAASGIGSLAKSAFDPFKMKRVEQGLSGGMSLPGTLASIIAPFLFLLISVGFGILDFKLLIICAVAAFLGALADSMLGSLWQVKFKCKSCGAVTEKNIHCGQQTVIISGFKIISNDAVNIISSFIAALISVVLFFLLNI